MVWIGAILLDMADWIVLYGREEIRLTLGVSYSQISKWIKVEGLPVCRAPNGMLMTTTGLIDNWILARRGIQGYDKVKKRKIKRQPPEFWESLASNRSDITKKRLSSVRRRKNKSNANGRKKRAV